jgi:Transposase DDE domain
MASIAGAVARIKEQPLEVGGILDAAAVEQAFAEQGYRWRERTLGPARTIELFIRQVIDCNESCGYVCQWAGGTFTPGAYCAARSRLPLDAFWRLCRRVGEQVRMEHEMDVPLWRGHRTFHLDGTSFSMPDTPELQEAFGRPGMQKAGCGFPAAHLLLSFDARTGMVLEAIPGPMRTHDLRDVPWIHEQLAGSDILIGDKAFGSWAHLALLQKRGMHGLFSLHQQRPVRGEPDQIQRWPKPPLKPAWMSRPEFDALPEFIQVRVVHRVIHRRGFRPVKVNLVTTLLDRQKYPAEELVELGRSRWSAELNLRHLKTTMGLEILKCKSVDGVLKELAIFLLVYNLVRAVMLKASATQAVAVDRISFADALAWIRCTGRGEALWRLLVNPIRPNRVEPRAIKRRPKPYDLLNKPRDQMRKALKNQAKAA